MTNAYYDHRDTGAARISVNAYHTTLLYRISGFLLRIPAYSQGHVKVLHEGAWGSRVPFGRFPKISSFARVRAAQPRELLFKRGIARGCAPRAPDFDMALVGMCIA